MRDIIDLPMDEFNDLLSKHELTEEQLTLCREIRRRGKNKVYFLDEKTNDTWYFVTKIVLTYCEKKLF